MRPFLSARNIWMAGIVCFSTATPAFSENGPLLRYGTSPTPHISVVITDGLESFFLGTPSNSDLDEYGFALQDSLQSPGQLLELGWYWTYAFAGSSRIRTELTYGKGRHKGVLKDGIGIFVEPVHFDMRHSVLRVETRVEDMSHKIGRIGLVPHFGLGAERYRIRYSVQSPVLDIKVESQTDEWYLLTGFSLERETQFGPTARLGLDWRFYRGRQNTVALTGSVDF